MKREDFKRVKELPFEFDKVSAGFHFKQIRNDNGWYIYEVTTQGGSKWYEVFKTREYLEDVNKDFNIPDNYITPICTVIEQQLGVHIPTKALIPNPNTPSEFFATACAIYYKFQK